MVLRGVVVGRGPCGNLFEFSAAFATSILGGYLFLQRRYPIRQIGFIPTGVALGAAAVRDDRCRRRSSRSSRRSRTRRCSRSTSGWRCISYGIFATAFAAGIGYLAQGTEDRFAWLPSHKTLDEVAYRSVIIGFPIFATMIVLGSWWASIAWSRYWGWDPKETAALVTWLIYAVYLHARNQRRVGGPARGAAARRRVRDGAGDLLGLALVQRPARLLGAVAHRAQAACGHQEHAPDHARRWSACISSIDLRTTSTGSPSSAASASTWSSSAASRRFTVSAQPGVSS